METRLQDIERDSKTSSSIETPAALYSMTHQSRTASLSDFEILIQKKVQLLPLPPVSINPKHVPIHYNFYTVYRRLFSVVFLGNFLALVIIITKHRTSTALFRAATANLVVCGLARLPYMINIIFLAVHIVARSTPMWCRRRAAKVGNYGGVHSGSGIAAIFWYICATANITRQYVVSPPAERPPTVVLTILYFILVLLLAMIVAAYPLFRFMGHNIFEFTHRFSSWVLIVLLWAAYLKLTHSICEAASQSWGHYLIHDASFWFVIILTGTLVAPWVTLRRVAVKPEYISDHAVRLHFDFATTKFSQGISIANHPLKDWHTFAGIPEPSGSGFSLLISNAGDWTSTCIKNQPTRIWKRAIPTYGFAHAALLFKKVVVITTGSGIGPVLSLLGSDVRPSTRVLWQTRNPDKTYGKGIMEAVQKLDLDPIIIDTDVYGRQDMMAISWSLWVASEAEAVFAVARPGLVKKLVNGFESRGVPIYAPIFDS